MTDVTTGVDDHADKTFADFDLNPATVEALKEAGIEKPFPIQAMTLPIAKAGNDVIGQAKTGTGKTLGFGLPLLDRVIGPGEDGYDDLPKPGAPQALIVVPTRELATQVTEDLMRASSKRSVSIVTIYGGKAYETQTKQLDKGVEVIVGTPGRLLDLAGQKLLDLGHVRCMVLDEADEMLDLGFLPDVERILALTPAGRQTMLFSATMPGPVIGMARNYMTNPIHVQAADVGDESQTVKNVKQVAYRAHAMDKAELLARILQANGRGRTMIFSRTKRTASNVSEDLKKRGFAAAAIHGDLGQGAREDALNAFRETKIDVLVATDVAARGIDVDDVTHVINYQTPEDHKTYVHRIGRTGRAGRNGVAVTFVDWDDLHRWSLINRELDLGIPEPVETYSTSPHVYEELDIPEGVTGELPKDQQTLEGLKQKAYGNSDGRGGSGGRGGQGRGGSGGGKDSSGGRGRGGQGRGGSGGRDSGGRGRGRGGEGSVNDGGQRRRSDKNGTGSGDAGASSSSSERPARESSEQPRRRRRRTRRDADGPASS